MANEKPISKDYLLTQLKNYETEIINKKYIEKEDGKGLSSNDYTTEEKNKLAGLENYNDTALSNRVKSVEDEIPNLATKTYVGEQIANSEHLKREIVTVLPSDTEASDNIIYMLKVESATGNDKYREYMKIDGTVQMVGDTSVDLTDYAKTADVNTALGKKVNTTDIVDSLSSDSTDKPLSAAQGKALDTKISDLVTTVEEGYAKKTDLHSHENKTVLDGITEEKVTAWDNKSDFSGSYNDLNDKPTIDAELSNTSENAIQNKVVTEEINKLYSDISFNDFDTATDGISFTDAEDGNMLVTNATRNLLNPTLETTTQNGVTCTNNGDGTYTLNGTATANAYFTLEIISNFEDNIYKIVSLKNANSNLYSYINAQTPDGETIYSILMDNARPTGYISKNKYISFDMGIAVISGTTLTNEIVKPMLTTDLNATYDDFVPYSGYDVKTCGKNLVDVNTFPSSQVLNGITFTTDKKAGTITLNGTATKDFNNHLFNFIVVNGIKEYSFGGWDNSKIEVIHDNLGLFSDDEFNFDGLRNITNINANKKHAINCVYRQGQVFDNFVIKPYVSANYNTYDGYDNIKPYQDGGTVHIDSTTEFPLLGLKSFDGITNIISPANVKCVYPTNESGKAILDMSENKLDKDNVVNNQTTTVEGFALDARQANPNIDGSLAKQISDLNGSLDNLVPVIDNCDLVTTHLAISNNALNNPYLSGVVSGAYALILTVWTPTPQPFNQQIAFVAGGDEIALRSCGGDGKWGAWKKINVN